MSAALEARRTAAAAVLADYQNGAGTADAATLSLEAARLASMLALVLDGLDAAAARLADMPLGERSEAEDAIVAYACTPPAPDAGARLEELRAVLAAFDLTVDDPRAALEEIDRIVNGDAR